VVRDVHSRSTLKVFENDRPPLPPSPGPLVFDVSPRSSTRRVHKGKDHQGCPPLLPCLRITENPQVFDPGSTPSQRCFSFLTHLFLVSRWLFSCNLLHEVCFLSTLVLHYLFINLSGFSLFLPSPHSPTTRGLLSFTPFFSSGKDTSAEKGCPSDEPPFPPLRTVPVFLLGLFFFYTPDFVCWWERTGIFWHYCPLTNLSDFFPPFPVPNPVHGGGQAE